jgi:hypothetical protein
MYREILSNLKLVDSEKIRQRKYLELTGVGGHQNDNYC